MYDFLVLIIVTFVLGCVLGVGYKAGLPLLCETNNVYDEMMPFARLMHRAAPQTKRSFHAVTAGKTG